MDSAAILLGRQSGLMTATDVVANNIANASTPGFKSEGLIFAEHVRGTGGGNYSTSAGRLLAHSTDFTEGAAKRTGGAFDLAIGGEGFFKVLTPAGERLTRAGSFTLDAEGTLTDPRGRPVADDAGGEIQLPPEATDVSIAKDGTISVDGEIFGIVGVFMPEGEMKRAGDNMWIAEGGDRQMEAPRILQGFLEQSNVDPVREFAEMIRTQRQFEAGQEIFNNEHDRLSKLIDAIRQG